MRRLVKYIHERENWTDFTWDSKMVLLKLGEARNRQGRLLGKMQSLGFDMQLEAMLNTLTLYALKSSEIEGEILNMDQVRYSAIAKQYPEQADELFAMAEADAKRKYEEYKKLAEQE